MTKQLKLKLDNQKNTWELSRFQDMAQKIKKFVYPTQPDAKTPEISYYMQGSEMQKYQLSFAENPLFLTTFNTLILLTSSGQYKYEKGYFFTGIYEIDQTTYEPKLAIYFISTQSTLIRDIEISPDGKYMFMASTLNNDTTIDKYKIHEVGEPIQAQNPKNKLESKYYFAKDNQYSIKLQNKIITELKCHPFGDYLIGAAMTNNKTQQKYLIKIDMMKPKHNISQSEPNCLRQVNSRILYVDNNIEFNIDQKHMIVSTGDKVNQSNQTKGYICLWNTEKDLPKVIDRYEFSNKTQLKYPKSLQFDNYTMKNFNIQHLKIISKEGTETQLSAPDSGNSVVHIFKVQRQSIEYSYSYKVDLLKGTGTRIQSNFILQLNMHYVSHNKDNKIIFYKINETNLQSAPSNYWPHKQQQFNFIKQTFYDPDFKKICYVYKDTNNAINLNCLKIYINCEQDKQMILLDQCIQNCFKAGTYFDSISNQCKSCNNNNKCTCPQKQQINLFTGECTINCSKYDYAIPHSEHLKNTECMCQQPFNQTKIKWSKDGCAYPNNSLLVKNNISNPTRNQSTVTPIDVNKTINNTSKKPQYKNSSNKPTIQTDKKPNVQTNNTLPNNDEVKQSISPQGVALIVICVIILLVGTFFVVRKIMRFYKKNYSKSQIQQIKQTERASSSDQQAKAKCSICQRQGVDCETLCRHRFHFGCIKQKVDGNQFQCPECFKVFHRGLEDIRIIYENEVYSIDQQ